MSVGMGGAWMASLSYMRNREDAARRLTKGTARRILTYAVPYRGRLAVLVVTIAIGAASATAVPVVLAYVIDDGVIPGNRAAVVWGAVAVAGLALLDIVTGLLSRFMSARVGHGLIFDLRRQVYDHVQRQPIAFFSRAQTGSLVSRLNTDVIGAQHALTGTLSQIVSNVITLVLVVAAMLLLSWQMTVMLMVLPPLFILPARYIGRKIASVSRQAMELNATMNQTMTERFNVAGALLVKIFGRYDNESAAFGQAAQEVRDVGIRQNTYGSYLFVGLTFLASLATAVVYGVGGWLAIDGTVQVGTLVALALLLTRLYGPLIAFSNVQVEIMTALVSFDRVFEVLDLRPFVRDEPEARPLSGGPLSVEFDGVEFAYPGAEDVSLASLESVALSSNGGGDQVLRDVSFRVEPGQLVALVGPSGAGKTTITQLVARLYDPDQGVVRMGGRDVRSVTLESLHAAIGIVTQDAHMFHDTIRANLRFARPDATEEELHTALRAAQISDLVESLPDGLDTLVGDRGYRLSGGEKQRMAIARLLLKAPQVVVLDEATAHLDSESEAAVQRALKTALTGRTSLVIAHRLSTIRDADTILVVDQGRIVERGNHEELLAAGGSYADLYRTQFALTGR